MNVALDGRDHDATLAVLVARFHVRFEECHGSLHDLGRLQHERQLHLSGAEQLADGLHAREQGLVDDGQWRLDRHRLGEVVVEAVALAVDDAAFEPVEQRKSRAISGTAVGKSPGHKSVRRSSASDRFRIEPHSRYTVGSCRLGAMYGERTVDSLGLAIIRIVLLR